MANYHTMKITIVNGQHIENWVKISVVKSRCIDNNCSKSMVIGDSITLERMDTGPRFSKHDDVIKWKNFPRYWPFVPGIHRSPVNSLHKGQWRGAFMFSLICVWINLWVNNREAGDLRRYRAHYDVIVMKTIFPGICIPIIKISCEIVLSV